MMTFLILNMIMLTMMFTFMNHPLSSGMILMAQTIIICLISSINNLNYWYSYILFLIMIGGMMVLFIYMTSIASNEKFKFSLNLTFIMLTFLILNMMFVFFDNFYMSLDMHNYEMAHMNNYLNFKFSLNKYTNFPNNLTFFSIIIYLFITLIASVKITKIEYGPLRQKF
uniref:NADH-ubiquinone oxidoreductase chain 6 n=1 Tax=Glischrochilus hortensis TaxID=295925 RepID=A0A0S2MPV9_9CUCU|nr:NADH deshydrogenase subunit 6 [Glischrochilus hortensis]